MAAVAVGWIVGRVVLARFVPWRVARTTLFGLAAVVALAVVVLPAYDDETVVEAFPVESATDATHEVPTPTVPATTVPTVVAVGEPSTPTPITTTTTTTTTTTAAPTGPVRLRVASFVGIDHRAAGTVTIYAAPDGRHVVGLEDFDIQPGPDYDVYVVPGSARENRDGGVRLDDLRGNQGTQFYDVPAGIDVGRGEWTVLIWCETFGVPVANATRPENQERSCPH